MPLACLLLICLGLACSGLALAQVGYPPAPPPDPYQQTWPAQPAYPPPPGAYPPAPGYPPPPAYPPQGAYPPPGQQGQPSIVGSWLFRSPEMEMFAQFWPNGTFVRSMRGINQPPEQISGTYALGYGVLELRPQGAPQVVRLNVRMPNPNTLELTDQEGSGVQMVRQGY